MKTPMLFEDMDAPEGTEILSPSGKDEMNFAEFPITLLTDRVPKGQKLIKFEDQIYDEKRKRIITRRRIIEGSEEYGLPTATDDLVILALIQLTKTKADFSRREVEFTRLELIKMLGWADEGRSYERMKRSLLRIKSVHYIYDNAWWDGRQRTWTTRAFNIIDNVEINDSRTVDGQSGLFTSRIVWNEVVFDSFQAGFLRDINFQLCLRLAHPTALRMYRFLGKRFYVRPDWLFDLREFAHEHMGLGRNYEGGTQIARKLKPAVLELEMIGFLEPLPDSERFIKKGRDWSIRFVQKSTAALPVPPEEPDVPCLETELVNRGVTRATATKLVRQHPAEFLWAKLDVFDWLAEKKDKKIARSPAGYIVKSINDDYAVPQGYVPKAERQRLEEERKTREQAADEARRLQREQEAREEEERNAVEAHLKALRPAERKAMEAEALASAEEQARQNYQNPSMAKYRDTLMLNMLRDHIRQGLRDQQARPSSE